MHMMLLWIVICFGLVSNAKSEFVSGGFGTIQYPLVRSSLKFEGRNILIQEVGILAKEMGLRSSMIHSHKTIKEG